jgi:tetratricopeptide (TPR) repeat protein
MIAPGHAPTVARATNARNDAGNVALYLSALVIVLAGLAAYHNSFSCPFVFDDLQSILENPTIHRLWPLGDVLSTPRDTGYTVSGRPVANLTLALNCALSGTAVWSYHLLNLAIHLGAGLALFGIVRRTLTAGAALRAAPGRNETVPLRRDALPLALAIALLWVVHPLQTEAVTYVIQRVESLMGLFYLLTLYGFIRGICAERADASGPRAGRASWVWCALSVAACLLGMATKEVMATAPILVLLYDRTFVAGSFLEAWRRRRWLHLALACTWLPLAWLVARTGWNRGGTSGFDVGIAPWAYWLTQFQAVARYLWLSWWPHPLVLDYESFWVHRAMAAVPYALIVVPLAVVTGLAVWRSPRLGFLGVWFFAILAPTSIMPGTIQMIVEHRMYLPVAALIAAGVLGVHALIGRRSLFLFGLLAVALGWVTIQRNRDYRSSIVLWQDTVEKSPGNPRAHVNLGKALLESGSGSLALEQDREALRLDPGNVVARFNLANACAREGRAEEARESYEAILRLQPDFANAHFYLAEALERLGRPGEAAHHYEAAIRLDPELVDARCNLGNLLLSSDRVPEAIGQYETALQLAPHSARLHYNLGNALVTVSRLPDAVREYEAALGDRPAYFEAHANLGNALFQLGFTEKALTHFQEALRLEPGASDIHANFGVALLQLNRFADAKEQFETALRLDPRNGAARDGLNRINGGSSPPAINR